MNFPLDWLSIIGYEFYIYKSSKNPYKTSFLFQGCQIKPKSGLKFEQNESF